jgi:hypothetical protein
VLPGPASPGLAWHFIAFYVFAFITRSMKPIGLCINVYIIWQFSNEGKSAASFCHQVAAWFCNFYLLKNQQKSTTTKAREKNKHRLGILRIL